jgi:cell division septation protein DedD
MEPRLYPEDTELPTRSPEGDWSIASIERPLPGDEPPAGGFGRAFRLLMYALVAIGCAAALWYAYSRSRESGGGPVPLIRADQGATKVKPDQPGGVSVPDQDKLVYNPSQPGAKVERLLPPPEQPLAKPLAPPPSADVSAPLPVQAIGPTAAPKAAPPTPAAAALPPATSSGMLTATSSVPLPPAAPPLAPVPAAASPPTAKPGQSAASGGFRIQLAATRDEATASSEWERLKSAHADLLGALSPSLIKVDLGDKGVFYRVQAGPVADRDKAERLCGALKQFAIACLIVKP